MLRPLGLVIFWLGGMAGLPCSGQLKSACDLLTAAQVAEASHLPIDTAQRRTIPPAQMARDQKRTQCDFYDSRLGPPSNTRPWTGVMVGIDEDAHPDPDGFAKAAKFAKVPPVNGPRTARDTRLVANLGDGALWSPCPSCLLEIYIGGTTRLWIHIEDAKETLRDIQEAAIRVARQALGGSGKTGYAYTIPDALSPPTDQTKNASSSRALKPLPNNLNAPNPADILDDDDVLIGQKTFSVEVHIEGMRDISQESMQSDIERRLRQAGIPYNRRHRSSNLPPLACVRFRHDRYGPRHISVHL